MILLSIQFSVLLCTYKNDDPTHLSEALDSICAQTVLPDELVIVKDGPLTEMLENVIADFAFPGELTIHSMEKHGSLGLARAAGVNIAAYPWVALMDSDDICRPYRFERQISQILDNPALSIIGGQIAEFDTDITKTLHIRPAPIEHDDILREAKKRNPFNAMTVMFRRDLALQAGNFCFFPGFEDYDLWTRMINHGAKCANCPQVLLDARIGNGLYARRRGLGYVRSEWRMQNSLLRLGLINLFEFVRNVLVRVPLRLMPNRCVEWAYRRFARTAKGG